MAIKAIAAVVAAAATVGSAAISARQGAKANKHSKRASEFERKKSELQSARQKISAIREARSAYAEARQGAENQGASASSGAQGGAGSIISQVNNNLSFLDQYGFLSDQSSRAMGKAQSSSNVGGVWSQIAGMGAQVYSATGGIGYKGPQPPKEVIPKV